MDVVEVTEKQLNAFVDVLNKFKSDHELTMEQAIALVFYVADMAKQMGIIVQKKESHDTRAES